jgi:cold shock protein
MSYRDTWATCEKCGKQFIFTVEEQRRLTELGFEPKPTQCPECQTAVELEPGQRQGVVKWYDAEKKYGFITQRSGDDIFFHRDGVVAGEKPQFPDGTPVTYRVEQSQKGPKAVDVARIDISE